MKKKIDKPVIHPHIALVDIGRKYGRDPYSFWTWEGWINEKTVILSDDIMDCVRFFSKNRRLLPKKIKDPEVKP